MMMIKQSFNFFYIYPTTTQCNSGPVCILLELLSTYCNLLQPSSIQFGVGQVCASQRAFIDIFQPSMVYSRCVCTQITLVSTTLYNIPCLHDERENQREIW